MASKVLCPLVGIAAARKTALEILEGNNSIAYEMPDPPMSCPTKITCVQTEKKVRNKQRRLVSKLDSNTKYDIAQFCAQ